MRRAGNFVLRFLMPVLLGALPGNSRAADPTPPLILERSVPLAGVSGRIDHMAIDLGRKRLFVAELGNGTVDVIDLASGKAVHRLSGLREPQGIGYAPKADVIAVANAGDGSVRLFRVEDFKPLGTVELNDDADNIRLDPSTGQLVVGYGSGALAFLDPVNHSVVSRAKLPAHPEGFQIDPATRRVIVNLPDARQIGVIDLTTGKQIATWRLPELGSNFPMAREQSGTIIATVFRNPARAVLLDAQTGAVRANLETCGDSDDVFFDENRKRIYVSCGAGAVDVFQQEPTGYRRLSQIATSSGARTSLFVPELDRLFVAARAGFLGLGSDAAILVFRPQP
jgi:DNA-binding beta-propeller fold protein YncE